MASAQAILTPLFGFYDSLFQPLLQLGPYPSLIFFSAVLAALFSVIYYIFLDRERADEIKEKLEEHQEKMKEAQEEDSDGEVSDHLEKSLKLNQKFMMLNLKPMIATMLFVGLIFPWLGASFAPNMDFTEQNNFTNQLEWAGNEVQLQFNNDTQEVTTLNQSAELNDYVSAHGVDWEVTKINQIDDGAKVRMNIAFIKLPFSLPLAGKALNWLGFYILIVMPLGYGLRKMMGVA